MMDGETIDSEDMQGDGAKLAMSARDVSQMLPTSSTSSLRSSRFSIKSRNKANDRGAAAAVSEGSSLLQSTNITVRVAHAFSGEISPTELQARWEVNVQVDGFTEALAAGHKLQHPIDAVRFTYTADEQNVVHVSLDAPFKVEGRSRGTVKVWVRVLYNQLLNRLPLDIEYTLDPLKGPLTGERASVVDFAPICVAEVLVHAGRKERQTMEKIVERFEEVFSVGALTHESNRSAIERLQITHPQLGPDLNPNVGSEERLMVGLEADLSTQTAHQAFRADNNTDMERLLSMTSFVAGDKAADLGEDTNNTGSGGSSGGSGGRSSGGHASVSGIFNWFDAGCDRPGSRSGHPGSGSGQGSGSNGNQSAGSGLLSQHASGLDQAVNIVTIPAPTISVLTDPTYSDLSSASNFVDEHYTQPTPVTSGLSNFTGPMHDCRMPRSSHHGSYSSLSLGSDSSGASLPVAIPMAATMAAVAMLSNVVNEETLSTSAHTVSSHSSQHSGSPDVKAMAERAKSMAETMEPMMAINQAINAVVEERKCREKVKSSSSSESRTSAERRRRASPRDDQEQIPIGLGAGSMGLNSSEPDPPSQHHIAVAARHGSSGSSGALSALSGSGLATGSGSTASPMRSPSDQGQTSMNDDIANWFAANPPGETEAGTPESNESDDKSLSDHSSKHNSPVTSKLDPHMDTAEHLAIKVEALVTEMRSLLGRSEEWPENRKHKLFDGSESRQLDAATLAAVNSSMRTFLTDPSLDSPRLLSCAVLAGWDDAHHGFETECQERNLELLVHSLGDMQAIVRLHTRSGTMDHRRRRRSSKEKGMNSLLTKTLSKELLTKTLSGEMLNSALGSKSRELSGMDPGSTVSSSSPMEGIEEGRQSAEFPEMSSGLSDFSSEGSDAIRRTPRVSSVDTPSLKSTVSTVSQSSIPMVGQEMLAEAASESSSLAEEQLMEGVNSIVGNYEIVFEELEFDQGHMGTHNRLGIGGYGEVFLGTWQGSEVAVKRLLEQDMGKLEVLEDFRAELDIQSRLRHANVVMWMGACTKPPNLAVVLEAIYTNTKHGPRGRSLHYILHKTTYNVTWLQVLLWVEGVTKGLIYLHSRNVMHCDLNTNNVLIGKDNVAKITDFGLSRVKVQSRLSNNLAASGMGTVNSTAPEVLRGDKFDGQKADAYSLGIMMWELATRSIPWKDWKPLRVYALAVTHGCAAVKRELRFPQDRGLPEGWEQLAHRCWSDAPVQRPTMHEIAAVLKDMISEEKAKGSV